MNKIRISLVALTTLLILGLLMTSLAVSEQSVTAQAGNIPVSEKAAKTMFTVPPQPGKILLLDDGGSPGHEGKGALDAFGYDYTYVSPVEFATVNLNDYNIIFVAWLPTQAEINALNARKTDLANWITNGGGIVVNAEWKDTMNYLTNPYSFLPVHFNTTDNPYPFSDTVQITFPSHPLVAGLTDALLSNWYSAVHGEINEYPPVASVVAIATVPGTPHITGMCYGAGKIVVTTSDPEFHLLYGSGEGPWMLLSNELQWAAIPCVSKPSVSISTDKSVYVPGETIQLNLSISNPTNITYSSSISVNITWPTGTGMNVLTKSFKMTPGLNVVKVAPIPIPNSIFVADGDYKFLATLNYDGSSVTSSAPFAIKRP